MASVLERLLATAYQAKQAHAEVLAAQAYMRAAAQRRDALVADLWYLGLSIGEVGEVLGVSKARAQRVVEDARDTYSYRSTPGLGLGCDGPMASGNSTTGGL